MTATSEGKRLREAWSDFCRRLDEAGDLIFRDTAPTAPVDQAAGFQYLSRYISKALNEKLEFNDPAHPQLWTLQTPTNKSFGDNPDCTYLTAHVDGEHTYRIVGNRGTVTWASFAVHGPFSTLDNADLQVEWDGSFSVVVSPEEHPGNWLRTDSTSEHLVIRQFFGEWDLEEPMRLRIECLDADGPPPPPDPDRIIRGLHDAVEWLIEDSTRWADYIDFYRDQPNTFVQGFPGWVAGGGQTELGRLVHFCQWHVQPDEALVIRFTPTESLYWNFEVGNYWMNSVDYRYRLSSINSKQATVEDDGSVVIVLAHRDPDVPNWLDTGGHSVGLMPQRWVDCAVIPPITTELVRFDALGDHLGAVRRITADERREQLRRRKIGVDRRFQA